MSEDKFKLDTIESAIRDIRDGKVVIVVDDKNRENEGDFLAAAELITPEIINFMATYGRGLICAPITENTSKRLTVCKSYNQLFLIKNLSLIAETNLSYEALSCMLCNGIPIGV